MTHPFGGGTGHHHHRGVRARTGTADSAESSVLSIRNLEDAPPLDLSAIEAARSSLAHPTTSSASPHSPSSHASAPSAAPLPKHLPESSPSFPVRSPVAALVRWGSWSERGGGASSPFSSSPSSLGEHVPLSSPMSPLRRRWDYSASGGDGLPASRARAWTSPEVLRAVAGGGRLLGPAYAEDEETEVVTAEAQLSPIAVATSDRTEPLAGGGFWLSSRTSSPPESPLGEGPSESDRQMSMKPKLGLAPKMCAPEGMTEGATLEWLQGSLATEQAPWSPEEEHITVPPIWREGSEGEEEEKREIEYKEDMLDGANVDLGTQFISPTRNGIPPTITEEPSIAFSSTPSSARQLVSLSFDDAESDANSCYDNDEESEIQPGAMEQGLEMEALDSVGPLPHINARRATKLAPGGVNGTGVVERSDSERSSAHQEPPQTLQLLGMRVPFLRWPIRVKKPSWSRVSSHIVRNAPCFWCASQDALNGATDRVVLVRLNILCAIFAAVQVGSGLFLFIVQWTQHGTTEERQLQRDSLTPNLWTLNGMLFFLALVGLIIVATMLLTLKVIRNVNLVGAVKYMWALYWIMPIEILFVVSLFDYHRVTDVWVKHWWSTPSMNWFRELFCLAGTAYTKCAMPVGGGSINTTEDEWCELNYNATDCSDIRSEAQQKMTTTSYIFVTGNGIWGVLLILLLFLALTLLEGIITAPIVQSSKETNIPAWLTLPIIGCLAGGSVLLFSPSSALSDGADSGVFWVGLVYMVASGMFFLAALLGWFISAFSVLNNRDKRHKQIAILLFIATMLLTVLSVAAILSTSLIYSASIVRIDYDDKARGNVACYLDTADSCTNCPKSPGHQPEGVWCPEWTDEEVVKVLQTQLKQSATLGAILLIYAFSALRFGFILHSHFSRYQIDYV